MSESIFHTISTLAKKYNAINLGQGYPDFKIDQGLKNLVGKYVQEGKNQYCPMPGLISLRQILANKYNNSYDCQLSPETDITITAGATQGLFCTMQAFLKEDDELVLIEPAYDSYAPVAKIIGAKVVSYHLDAAEDFKIDWNKFKTLVNDKTRMIIVNTPHNPIGKTLKEADFNALTDITANKNIVVLSDEVYEHMVFDKEAHQSILRYPALRDRAIAVYSFGKTFHATGWKMGYTIANKDLTAKIRAVHQWNVFCVNSFLQHALADHLTDPSNYEELSILFQTKRDHFQSLMAPSRFKALSCEGSYFQLYDYSAISDMDDISFAKWLCEKAGVASIPLSPFYTGVNNSKLIRFCFAKKESTLESAAGLLNKL